MKLNDLLEKRFKDKKIDVKFLSRRVGLGYNGIILEHKTKRKVKKENSCSDSSSFESEVRYRKGKKNRRKE